MTWALRHLVALAIVTVALACGMAVFLFARPAYHPYTHSSVNMATQRHYTMDDVQRSFALHGITLVRRSTMAGAAFLGDRRDDGLVVTVFGARSRVDFNSSTRSAGFHERVGNVDVEYTGHDPVLARRVTASVETLGEP